MNIKKIGNEKTYVEFNPIVNFGTKLRHKKISGILDIQVDGKGGMVMSTKDIPFENTAECFLLCKQVKKIVENGIEIYSGKEELKPTVLESVVYNTENLYEVLEELNTNNGLKEKEEEKEEKKQ